MDCQRSPPPPWSSCSSQPASPLSLGNSLRQAASLQLLVPQKAGLSATGQLANVSKTAGFGSVSALLQKNPNAKALPALERKASGEACACVWRQRVVGGGWGGGWEGVEVQIVWKNSPTNTESWWSGE